MNRKALWVSIALNLCLIAVGLFFSFKRFNFQKHSLEQKAHRRYFDNPLYKFETSLQQAYIMPAKVVMLGNSHTYYARWNELLNRDDVANRGIGTDITAGFLHRLDQVFKAHPKYCFIEGGENDVYFNIDMDTIMANLGKLVDTLRQAGITPILTMAPPVRDPEPGAEDFNGHITALNYFIGQLAAKKGCDVIGLYHLMEKGGFLNPELSQDDGVHLNGEGYLRWAREINFRLRNWERGISHQK